MKISKEKKEKISEQIIALLYSSSPKSLFTSHIAAEIARDEDFIKPLLCDLSKKKILVEIKKNPKGEDYIRRKRWKLSDEAYKFYKEHQAL